jgi:hypothetical protein
LLKRRVSPGINYLSVFRKHSKNLTTGLPGVMRPCGGVNLSDYQHCQGGPYQGANGVGNPVPDTAIPIGDKGLVDLVNDPIERGGAGGEYKGPQGVGFPLSRGEPKPRRSGQDDIGDDMLDLVDAKGPF